MVGWGRRPSYQLASWIGKGLGLPVWVAEDAFIRSLGLGVRGAEPFGFVLDRTGIGFDASMPSDLEDLIRRGDGDVGLADSLRARVVAERVSKYNHCTNSPVLPPTTRRRILLVDQTAGDRSLALGLAGSKTFARMGAAARAEHPDAEIIVKVHPDVLAGRRAGCLFPHHLPDGATVLGHDCEPYALLAMVDAVWVATSQLGFEALLAGRPVTCFGVPWYAGWGLTDDRGPVPDRRRLPRSLDQVFAAGYLQYSRYADPILGEACGLERILDRIADHRRTLGAGSGRWWLLGMSWRKQRILPRFLAGNQVTAGSPRRIMAQAAPEDRIAVWGVRRAEEADRLATDRGAAVVRIEDGFLRSVGLGSDLVRPGSLIFDDAGIYFDPRTPSRLEHLLEQHPFTAAESERGRRLIDLLRTTGVTKYNTGTGILALPAAARGRRVVLVPGQVEDDASIRCGAPGVARNRDLLYEVRRLEPEAFLIYKPHPDVLAGNRIGAVPKDIAALADLTVEDVGMDACLRAVDAVHTMTSLTGFEALVHGKSVTCHGIPFYSGWGLTKDVIPCPRRTRKATLEHLVVASLVLYPRYLDWDSGWFCGPEAMIEILHRRRTSQPASARMPPWRRLLKKMVGLVPGRRN